MRERPNTRWSFLWAGVWLWITNILDSSERFVPRHAGFAPNETGVDVGLPAVFLPPASLGTSRAGGCGRGGFAGRGSRSLEATNVPAVAAGLHAGRQHLRSQPSHVDQTRKEAWRLATRNAEVLSNGLR